MATKLSRTATYLDLLLLIKVPFEFNMKMLLISFEFNMKMLLITFEFNMKMLLITFEFNMKMLLITEWNEAEEKNILFLSIP